MRLWEESYHCDDGVQQAAVPEPMRPGALGGHHAGVIPLALGEALASRELGAIMARDVVALEAGAV